MPGLIPRPVHAVLDYVWAAALFKAPELVGFEDEGNAYLLCKVQATTTATTSLLTRYECGLLRALPFKAHLDLDTLSAVLGLASPWLLDFSQNKKARNTALAFFLIDIVVVVLTDRASEA